MTEANKNRVLTNVRGHLEYLFNYYDIERALHEGYGYAMGVDMACCDADISNEISRLWNEEYLPRYWRAKGC